MSKGTRTVVIKIGTSSIYNETTQHPNLSYLSILIETIVTLLSSTDPKFRVVLVSSGAVGLGMKTLGLTKKPKQLSKKQALAAVGQNKLMNLYDLLFSQFGTSIGQVLLTRNDIHERSKYLNACNTFNELLSMGIVPIVNENDTVSVAEIRFGDNDTLSAVTANMVKADILILLTDVECMYTDNPRTNPEAKAVYVVDNVFSDSLQQVNTQSGGSSLGTGGMVTKIVAAKLATSAGIEVVISSGKAPNKIPEIIRRVFSGESPSDDFKYTHFKALKEAIRDRKWWIQFGLKPNGCIVIDDGAFTAVSSKHAASLFAVGITSVEGNFSDQEVVSVKHNGEIVGQGIVNYSSEDMKKIVGIKGDMISEVLGFDDYDCVIHRDNLVISKRKASTD